MSDGGFMLHSILVLTEQRRNAEPASSAAITPGKPSQNDFTESFNGKLRDECLNETEFLPVSHARDLLEAFREDYNHQRLHSSLADLTPAKFAAKIARAPVRTPLDLINPSLAVETLVSKPTSTDLALSF